MKWIIHITIVCISVLVWSTTWAAGTDDFVTVWEIPTDDFSLTFPVYPTESIDVPTLYPYDYTIDCGNGTILEHQNRDATCTYAVAGTYEIRISGIFSGIYINDTELRQYIKEVKQWGTGQWRSFRRAFQGAFKMTVTATDIPDISAHNFDMAHMFFRASAVNPDLSGWDIAHISNFTLMFGSTSFSQSNYDKLLASWSRQDVQIDAAFSVLGLTYCNTAARSVLVNKGWGLLMGLGDSLASSCPPNDPPTASPLPQTISFAANSPLDVDLSGVLLGDTDNDILTMTLSTIDGTLTATGNEHVTILGSGTNVLSLSGTPEHLQTYLDDTVAIQYNTPRPSNIQVILRDARTAVTLGDISVVDRQPSVPVDTVLPDTIAIVPGTDTSFDLSSVDFAGADYSIRTLTLRASAGTWSAAGDNNITVDISGTTLTLTGTILDLHNYLDTASAIQYNTIAAGIVVVTIQGTDGTVSLGDISITNDFPTAIGIPAGIALTPGVNSPFDLSGATFADTDNDIITVTLSASTGSWQATSTDSVTATISGTTLMLVGTPNNINTYLDTASAIRYNTDTSTTITITAHDGRDNIGLGSVGVLVNYAYDPFITTWRVTTSDLSVVIPTYSATYQYNYSVDCSAAARTRYLTAQTGNATCEYDIAGDYTIGISGTFPGIHLHETGQQGKLVAINQWGTGLWSNFTDAFRGASQATVDATDIPRLADQIQASGMFRDAGRANPDVSAWNASAITHASDMFTNSGLTATNYDKLLAGWSQRDLQDNVTFGAGNNTYCNTVARQTMTTKGWFFVDDSPRQSCLPNTPPSISFLPNSIVIDDRQAPIDLSGVVLTDPDDNVLTLYLSATAGTFTALPAADIIVAGSGTNFLELSGTIGSLHRYLDNPTIIQYGSQTGSTIHIFVRDNRAEILGAGIPVTTNFSPTTNNNNHNLPTDISIILGTDSPIDLSGVTFADIDGDDMLTIILSADAGAWATPKNGSITTTISNAGRTLTLVGRTNKINTYLNKKSALQYNTDVATTITVTARSSSGNRLVGIGTINLSAAFITTWTVTSDNLEVFLPVYSSTSLAESDTYDYSVDCGGGGAFNLHVISNNPAIKVENEVRPNAGCQYTTPGTYTIQISGTYPGIFLDNRQGLEKLTTIEQWGTIEWKSFSDAFAGSSRLAVSPDAGIPDLSAVVSTRNMFYNASVADPDVSGWDTSNIEDMGYMFYNASAADPDVSGWDVSSVIRAPSMFTRSGLSATNYDKLLEGWSIQDLQSGVSLGVRTDSVQGVYCNAAARNAMIAKGWTFSDNTPASSCPHNDPPTVSGLPQTISFAANTPIDIDLSSARLDDIQDDIVTLALSATDGILTATGNETITIAGSGTTTLGISGTSADLQTYLADTTAIQYNTPEQSTINVTVRDARDSVQIARIPVSSPPLVTMLPDSISVLLDQPTPLDLSGVTFANAGNDIITFTLSATAGVWRAPSRESVIATVSDTTLSLMGTSENIRTYLSRPTTIQYRTNSAAVITATVDQSTSDTVSLGSINVSIAPNPPAPSLAGISDTDWFVTKWKTTTPHETITIPTYDRSGYNYIIDCGNGTILADRRGNAVCRYDVAGTYTVKITGDFPGIFFSNVGDKEKLVELSQWGSIRWTSFANAFAGAEHMIITATDTPDLSRVSSLAHMFAGATSANPNTTSWNTSIVTDMSFMFYRAAAANPDTSRWDTSAVTDMAYMFSGATSANPNTTNWDTSAVTDMAHMFFQALVANPDTSRWDTSAVTDMNSMFLGVATATPDTTLWDTREVTDMSFMFAGATSANPNTTGWDTSAVTSMFSMFFSATAANPDVSGWDTSAVTNMSYLFANASSADPTVSRWNISAVTTAEAMFNESAITTENYDKLLFGWARQTLVSDQPVLLGARTQTYCNTTAHANMTNAGWRIIDDGVAAPEECDALPGTLNIDGDASLGAATDGILIARYIASVRGPSLIAGAISGGATRRTADKIDTYIQSLDLDIDGNGTVQASTDGILIARYIASVRGESLIAGAIAGGATRSTVESIVEHLDSLIY